MTAPNISHQSGQARAFIEHLPFQASNKLYVTLGSSYLKFEDAGMVFHSPETEGERYPHTNIEWSDQVEDEVIDVFKAIAKALEIYSDEPGQAYKQGFAEGESKVLREWNESLRG